MLRDFSEFEGVEILTTAIENDGVQDTRFWSLHPKGKYTVKTGYKKAMDLHESKVSANHPSGSKRNEKWWNDIWGAKIPPKIKMFWWQLSWDIVPTDKNLVRRHVPIDQSCKLCGFGEDSSFHALFDCHFVKKVWSEGRIKLLRSGQDGMLNIDFVEQLFHLNPSWLAEQLMTVIWATWKKRCEALHRDEDSTKMSGQTSFKSVEWALHMVEEYKQACDKSTAPFTYENNVIPAAVVRNMGSGLLIFTDASYNPDNGSYKMGVVVTNEKGRLLERKTGELGTLDSPLEAEIMAIHEGIKQSRRSVGRRCIIFTDCLEAANAINDGEEFWNRGGYTLESIREELRHFASWKIFHIGRDLNEAAHLTALLAFAPTDSPNWISFKVSNWLQKLQFSLLV